MQFVCCTVYCIVPYHIVLCYYSLMICVCCVWDGEKENRDIDRGGECSLFAALFTALYHII